MGFWNFIASIVGAVVGAIVSGIARFFAGRREETARHDPKPVQHVLIIAPTTLLQTRVTLDEETRDILEIPRWKEPDLYKPKLLIPGEGIVNSDDFISYAIGALLDKAADPVNCVACDKREQMGAFFEGKWFCARCFYRYLKELTLGEQTIFNGGVMPQTRMWTEIQEMLNKSDGIRKITYDKTVKKLFEIPE